MNKDLIFILTDKYHGMILDFQKTESGAFEIVTICHGSLKVTLLSGFMTNVSSFVFFLGCFSISIDTFTIMYDRHRIQFDSFTHR